MATQFDQDIEKLNRIASEIMMQQAQMNALLASLTAEIKIQEAQKHVKPEPEEELVSMKELCLRLNKSYNTIKRIMDQEGLLEPGVHFSQSETGYFQFNYHKTRAALAARLGLPKE